MEAMEAMHYLVWGPAQGQHCTEKRCCGWCKKFSDSQCPSTGLIRLLHLCDASYNLRAASLKKSQTEIAWTLLQGEHILYCHWLSFGFTWGCECKPITNCSFVYYWDTNPPRHRPQVRMELGAMVLYMTQTFPESAYLFEAKLYQHVEEF